MAKPQDRFRLSGVRLAVAEVARALRRLRRVELAGRRTAAGNGARLPVAASVRARRRGGAARLYSEIELEQHARMTTGIGEFDRVLGGGIVPGSLVLLGGEPGIGKSTLLLQAAANVARTAGAVLYSSGEESEHQIKSRGERLAVGTAPLYLLAETCLERILEEIARIKPALVIVDSVQTVFSLKFQSAPGSIGQVREAATQLLFTAKGQNIPIFLVGHITKDGSLAGPKALEHVVDTVLYFEGERHHSHRVVRAVKNRFGAASELGVFEMTASGLRPVPNPSKMFLAERPVNAPGSAVLCSVEGSRPILVEVQALVSASTLRQRAPHGERHRSGAAVAAAGGPRKARRPEPDWRRCVRERRGGHDGRRTGIGPQRSGGDRVERSQPRDPGDHGDVRGSRARRRNTRRHSGHPARARGGADGVPPLHHAGGEHRPGRPRAASPASLRRGDGGPPKRWRRGSFSEDVSASESREGEGGDGSPSDDESDCELIGVRTVGEALDALIS